MGIGIFNPATAVLLAGRLTQTVEGVLEADAFNDITAPTLVSSVIGSSGTTLTRTYSEKVKGHAGFTINSDGPVTATYVSGDKTKVHVFSLSRLVLRNEELTEDYAPGDVEDNGWNQLAAYSGFEVTNNSTIEFFYDLSGDTCPSGIMVTRRQEGNPVTGFGSDDSTAVDENGNVKRVWMHQPRDDHDAITPFDGRGLLIEPENTNLLLNSDFAHGVDPTAISSWAAGAHTTLTGSSAIGPDGGMTAASVVAVDAGTNVVYFGASTIVAVVGQSYTGQIYVKPNGCNWVFLDFYDGTEKRAWFNLQTGEVGTKEASLSASSITPAANGFYRIAANMTSAADTTVYFQPRFADGDGASDFTSDGTDGIHVWGGNLKKNASLDDTHIHTELLGATAQKRYADKIALFVKAGGGDITVRFDDNTTQTFSDQPEGLLELTSDDLTGTRAAEISGSLAEPNVKLIFLGDSQTAGHNIEEPFWSYIFKNVYVDSAGAIIPSIKVRGISGYDLGYVWDQPFVADPPAGTLIEDAVTSVDTAVEDGKKNFLIFYSALNGPWLASQTAEQWLDDLDTLIIARKANVAEWNAHPEQILVALPPPRGANADQETKRQAIITGILAAAVTHGFTPIEPPSDMFDPGSQNDGTRFQDTIHFTNFGGERFALPMTAEIVSQGP